MRASRTKAGSLLTLGMALLSCGYTPGPAPADEAARSQAEVARGKELFLREWLPDDSRAHGGDGLGPVFNDSSCVACHNLAAPGGAGPSSKDVPILSAFPGNSDSQTPAVTRGLNRALARAKTAADEAAKAQGKGPLRPAEPDPAPLIKVHAGFQSARSVVLHRYGTDPSYGEWRHGVLSGNDRKPDHLSREDVATAEIAQVRISGLGAFRAFDVPRIVPGFQLVLSRRNTPPLFGSGPIDAIPDAVIAAGAQKVDARFPEALGRVSRLEGDKIGRFGWKGQTASLQDFVLTACAVELGLEVPGHSQGALPNAPGYRTPGLDLDASECASLVAYVRSLPAPAKREPANSRETATIRAGEESFRKVGCAACHVPKLGDVENLYSDLLLHDMGEALSDSGSYGVFVNDGAVADARKEPEGDAKARKGAERREWRTPPLWGFRDSGPYLHDGRAENLEQAVAFHEGQAGRSAQQFFLLSPKQRQKIEVFLKSLVAPGASRG